MGRIYATDDIERADGERGLINRIGTAIGQLRPFNVLMKIYEKANTEKQLWQYVASNCLGCKEKTLKSHNSPQLC